MRDRLILLSGWAFGPAALQPLCDALAEQAPHLAVDVFPLPSEPEPDAWLEVLEAQLPEDSWLAGWSLGGMLAAQLAARRGERCRGLITVASNPVFRANESWPAAMPADVFDTFFEAFRLDAEETLKRFCVLTSRGGYDARTLARQLQVTLAEQSPAALDAGLQLLARLDVRAALADFRGPQLHLFAERDALVPIAAAEALVDVVPDAEVAVLDGAGHGLPLERADDVAATLLAFLREGEDG
ncbi:alpha/beta fold hydrolase [Stutzerimonas urumqiensis]|uniref:alpha/beta fold hydrolase n=1 Tax=Stutzerimonas urumqiensis TaxID=638269 RepID=UPI000EAE9393|nr:alpha/beta fold hydrolase [Stutzerimonas urumqiensis]